MILLFRDAHHHHVEPIVSVALCAYWRSPRSLARIASELPGVHATFHYLCAYYGGLHETQGEVHSASCATLGFLHVHGGGLQKVHWDRLVQLAIRAPDHLLPRSSVKGLQGVHQNDSLHLRGGCMEPFPFSVQFGGLQELNMVRTPS